MRKAPKKTRSIAAEEDAQHQLQARLDSVQPKNTSAPKTVITIAVDVPKDFDETINIEAKNRDIPVEHLRAYLIKHARAILLNSSEKADLAKYAAQSQKLLNQKQRDAIIWQRISLSASEKTQELLHATCNDPLKIHSDMKCARAILGAIIATLPMPQ